MILKIKSKISSNSFSGINHKGELFSIKSNNTTLEKGDLIYVKSFSFLKKYQILINAFEKIENAIPVLLKAEYFQKEFTNKYTVNSLPFLTKKEIKALVEQDIITNRKKIEEGYKAKYPFVFAIFLKDEEWTKIWTDYYTRGIKNYNEKELFDFLNKILAKIDEYDQDFIFYLKYQSISLYLSGGKVTRLLDDPLNYKSEKEYILLLDKGLKPFRALSLF